MSDSYYDLTAEIFSSNPDGILVIGSKGEIYEANPAACIMLGMEHEEIILGGLDSLTEAAAEGLLLRKALRSSPEKGHIVLIIKRPDGSSFTAELNWKAFKVKDGDSGRLFFIKDLSERSRLENQISATEKNLQETIGRYKAFIEKAADAVFVHGMDGKFVEVNQYASRLMGYSREELLTMSVFDLELNYSPETARQEWEKIQPGEPFTLLGNGKRKDGSVFPVEIRFGCFFWKGEKLFLGLVRDITERIESGEKIKKNELRYRTIFEQSVVPVWEEDFSEVKNYFNRQSVRRIKNLRSWLSRNPDKVFHVISLIKILEINQTSVRFFGMKSKEEVILNLSLYFEEDALPILTEELIRIAAGDTEFSGVFPLRIVNGKKKYIYLKLSVVPGYEEDLSRVLVSWIDITDRIRYEEMQKKVNNDLRDIAKRIEIVREKERKAISLNLHDDLGQQLTALKMELLWLLNDGNLKKPEAHERITHMTGVIDGSIDTIRNIASDLRPSILYDFGLKDAITSHLDHFSKSTGIKTTAKISGLLPKIGDNLAIVLFRIMQEAMTNVARHSGATSVVVSLHVRYGKLILRVKDNGCGIQEDVADKPESIGLIGMKERARTYEGELLVKGRPGKGTVIVARIPYYKETRVKETEDISNQEDKVAPILIGHDQNSYN